MGWMKHHLKNSWLTFFQLNRHSVGFRKAASIVYRLKWRVFHFAIHRGIFWIIVWCRYIVCVPSMAFAHKSLSGTDWKIFPWRESEITIKVVWLFSVEVVKHSLWLGIILLKNAMQSKVHLKYNCFHITTFTYYIPI